MVQEAGLPILFHWRAKKNLTYKVNGLPAVPDSWWTLTLRRLLT